MYNASEEQYEYNIGTGLDTFKRVYSLNFKFYCPRVILSRLMQRCTKGKNDLKKKSHVVIINMRNCELKYAAPLSKRKKCETH